MRSISFASVVAALTLLGTTALGDSALDAKLRHLAAKASGRAGVSVVHIESGQGASVNGDERFPMMSVYKLPIAIHALRELQRARLDLNEVVTLGEADRRPGFSPMAESIAASGPLTVSVRDVIVAVVTRSDNTASDWLLRRIGGPRAVSRTLGELRLAGIDVSRYELQFSADYYGVCCVEAMRPFSLDRFAQAVERVPADVREKSAVAYERDPRDAATPAGMAALLVRLQRGELLNERNMAWLLELMTEMHARDTRIRAGLPPGTSVALRPGTSGLTGGVRAAHNDVGIITLPAGRGHLAVAIFLKGAGGTDEQRDATIAGFARTAYDWAVAKR